VQKYIIIGSDNSNSNGDYALSVLSDKSPRQLRGFDTKALLTVRTIKQVWVIPLRLLLQRRLHWNFMQ